MANPYHHTAKGTAKAKMKALHREHHHVDHADAAQDRAMIKKAVRHHEHKAHGMKAGGRLDRGNKHRKVKISIEKSGPPNDPSMMGGPMGAQPGAPPPATPMPPPGMGSGPMPPPPGPMGMQKKGGRVKHRAKGGRAYIEGESSAKNLKAWGGHASKNSYAKGGRIGKYPITAGQATGEARLEQADSTKKRHS